MATNTIDASVEFSFKGEDYTYKTSIDLDQLLRKHDSLPSLHAILAQRHGVDTYSYLYEVMQEAEIEFSNPQGLAADYLVNGEFDQTALTTNWQAVKTNMLLTPIATSELGITDLNLHPALKRALISAYNLGRTS